MNRGVILDHKLFSLPVMACVLGYMVDTYDLVLFNAVRMASLAAIGIPPDRQLDAGILLINTQMAGLVIGGFVFGILGDRFGRTRVLFASIFIYSAATFANAFVTSLPAYIAARFFAGLGLAGELGLAITLVSELISKEKRGYAAALIAGFGMMGAVFAGLSALYLDWKVCYMVGGAMGIVLLILRGRVVESILYQLLESRVMRGSLRQLFLNFDRAKRFVLCIAIGIPIPFVFWMLIAFAPEITKNLGLSAGLPVAEAVVFGYIGLSLGDLISIPLSQMAKSRRRVLILFQSVSLTLCMCFLNIMHPDNINLFRAFYLLLGITGGYWALMALIAAEMFGTNLRATVATSVPNLARAFAIPMGLVLSLFKEHMDIIQAATLIGLGVFAIGILAAFRLQETYGRELDYIES